MNRKKCCHALVMMGFFLLSIFYSCKKTDDLPERSSNPAINILSISKDTLIQFVDSMTIKLEYDDLEGDIGTETTEDPSLWIKDSRLAEADFLHIPPLAPIGDTVHIRGILNIHIPQLYLLSTDQEEELNFQIRLKDRAGNWSSKAISPPIIVLKE